MASEHNAEHGEEEQREDTHYHVTVYHTDTLSGAPDLHKEQVMAPTEQEAIERVKNRPGWPEEEFYSEEDDVEVRA